MRTIILFFITISVCLGQIHTGVLSQYNAAGGGASPETGEIFADDFEDGTFDAWTTVNSDVGDTNYVTSDTVNAGTYAALFEWNGVGNDSYIQVEPADLDATKVYFRMYIRVDHFFRGKSYGNTFAAVTFWDGSTEVARTFIRTGNTDENPDFSFLEWRAWIRGSSEDEGAEQDGYTHDTWLRFELAWEQNGTSAWATIKVDGDSIIGVAGQDHSAYFIDKIRVSAYNNVPMDSSIIRVDDVVIDSLTWVGAKP